MRLVIADGFRFVFCVIGVLSSQLAFTVYVASIFLGINQMLSV